MQTLNVRISGVPDPVVVKVPNMGYIRGRDGKDGEDGFSPTIDVEDVEGGHEITITDKEGEQSFLVKDGGAGTFLAIYGVTTLEELDAAFDAGKTIIAVEDIPFGLLVYYTLVSRDLYMPVGGETLLNKYTFIACALYGRAWNYVCECKADGWTQRTIDVATEDYVRLNAVWHYQGEENAGKLLAVGNDGDITLIPNTSGASTFVAVYGTTTLAELDAAYAAGKTIFAHQLIPFNLDVWYIITKRTATQEGNIYSFATWSTYGDSAVYLCQCDTNGWTGSRADLSGAAFLAVYDVTTQAELDEAYNAGKILMCRLPSGWLAQLQQVVTFAPGSGAGNTYVFVALSTRYEVLASFANGAWSAREYAFAQEEKVVLKDQGRGNAGKVLVVASNGEVEPGDPPGSVRKGTISLSAQWDGDGLYTQTVTVPGIPVTANSKVDLQPDMEEIEQLAGDGVAALYVENDNGVLTAYAAGAAPSSAMTLQCTVTEVRA